MSAPERVRFKVLNQVSDADSRPVWQHLIEPVNVDVIHVDDRSLLYPFALHDCDIAIRWEAVELLLSAAGLRPLHFQ